MSDAINTGGWSETPDAQWETISLRMHPDDIAGIRKVIRHWERWHNCEGQSESGPHEEARATLRGLAVMDIFKDWLEDSEGVDVDLFFDAIEDDDEG